MGISTYNENDLHAALKQRLAQPGAEFEVPLAGYIIDVVQPDGHLLEIQTRQLGKLTPKLNALSTFGHSVTVVLPLAATIWLQTLGQTQRRKSPKRATFAAVFNELVHAPTLLNLPGVSLQLLLTEELITRQPGGSPTPRRPWRIPKYTRLSHTLITILDQRHYPNLAALQADYIPASLPRPFTTATLAQTLSHPKSTAHRTALARQICYVFHAAGALQRIGKHGNAYLYAEPTT